MLRNMLQRQPAEKPQHEGRHVEQESLTQDGARHVAQEVPSQYGEARVPEAGRESDNPVARAVPAPRSPAPCVELLAPGSTGCRIVLHLQSGLKKPRKN